MTVKIIFFTVVILRRENDLGIKVCLGVTFFFSPCPLFTPFCANDDSLINRINGSVILSVNMTKTKRTLSILVWITDTGWKMLHVHKA